MHKSEVKAVFLAVLLIAGTITIGIHFDDAQASSDRKDQKDKKDRDHDKRDKKDSRDHDDKKDKKKYKSPWNAKH